MSVIAAPPGWSRPPPEECEESAVYEIDPSGGNMTAERIKVRMVDHRPTSTLADFAVIQQTYDRGKWRIVAEVDSSHDDEVHVHWWSRKEDARVGDPEQLRPVACLKDIGDGYDEAYARIVQPWQANKRRWHDA